MITSVFSHLFIIPEILNVILPRWAKRFAAGVITRACFLVLPRTRQTVRRNLAPVVPEASERELARMAWKIVINYGNYFVDYFGAFSARVCPRPEEYFNRLIGWENLERAMSPDRGMVLVTPHLGNWELGLLTLRDMKLNLAVLTARITSRNMEAKLEQFRRRMGVEIVMLEDPAQHMFAMKRLLSEKKTVVLLGDRYMGGVSDMAPFFGKPARLPTGYLHLARMFDAPVLPCFIVRNETGKYSCIADEPIVVAHNGDRDDDVRAALQQVIGVFERRIREYVLQWYRYTPVWEDAS